MIRHVLNRRAGPTSWTRVCVPPVSFSIDVQQKAAALVAVVFGRISRDKTAQHENDTFRSTYLPGSERMGGI